MTTDIAHIATFSALMALLATVVALPIGVALGWLLARRTFPGRSLVETVAALPLVMPPVATGLLLLWLFGRRSPVGRALDAAGIEVVFTWKAVVIAMAVMRADHRPHRARGLRAAQSTLRTDGGDAGRASAAHLLHYQPAARRTQHCCRRAPRLCALAGRVRRDDRGRRRYSRTDRNARGCDLQSRRARARHRRHGAARRLNRARLCGDAGVERHSRRRRA